jgi:hypothetical protein
MTARHPLAYSALFFVAAACGGGSTSPPPQGLGGSWSASKIEFVAATNSSTKVDIIPLGGAASLVLNADNTFQFTMALPGEAPLASTGTWSATSDVVTMNFATGLHGNWQFDMTLSGNTLNLTGAGSEFDFNDDGHAEDARLNLVFTRR